MELAKAYYSIKEVSEIAHIKPHVIRYWESEFRALKPKKTHGGRRRYSIEDLKLLLIIKKLLYEDGYTIKGARRKVAQLKKSGSGQIELPFEELKAGKVLVEVKRNLKAILDLLGE
jgi:DNA-binding transcriptional MerR regulator